MIMIIIIIIVIIIKVIIIIHIVIIITTVIIIINFIIIIIIIIVIIIFIRRRRRRRRRRLRIVMIGIRMITQNNPKLIGFVIDIFQSNHSALDSHFSTDLYKQQFVIKDEYLLLSTNHYHLTYCTVPYVFIQQMPKTYSFPPSCP